MKIVFKTGQEVQVPEYLIEAVTEVLKKPIDNTAVNNFQAFYDNEGKLHLLFNLSEILYIQ